MFSFLSVLIKFYLFIYMFVYVHTGVRGQFVGVSPILFTLQVPVTELRPTSLAASAFTYLAIPLALFGVSESISCSPKPVSDLPCSLGYL